MSKKTFKVYDFICKCNSVFALDNISQENKAGIAAILHDILHQTGNYAGYNHNFNWTDADETTRERREYDRHYHIKTGLTP